MSDAFQPVSGTTDHLGPFVAGPLLVGREREQAVLSQSLDSMLAGRGSLVLVSGEAGIGKTTLVEDLSSRADTHGVIILWGHAYDLSVTPPYGPWLELLSAYPQRDALPPLPRFVNDLEATAALGSQEHLFVAARDFFQAVAAVHPLLLILEDVHWADEASLDLLRFVTRHVAQQRILVVTTYRSDELHRQHPLAVRLPALVRETQTTRLALRPLTDAAQRMLIRSRHELSEADDSRLAHYLVQHAEGNPLYAGELLRTLEEQGVLVPTDGGWQLGSLEQLRVPPLLRQVIDMRVDRLGDAARALLAAAAVIGATVPLAIWQTVSTADEVTLDEVLERAAAARLMEEVGDGSRARFTHALIREALYEGIASTRRRRLHRLVGEILAAEPEPDADGVAHHFRLAGDERAANWLIAAGERAERAYAYMSAAERFEAALPLLARQRASAMQRGWLFYRLAVLRRFGDAPRSVEALEEAGRLATEAGDVALAAYALVMRGHVRCFAGDLARGISELEAGIAAVAAIPAAERSRLDVLDFVEPTTGTGTLIFWLSKAGRLTEARALGEAYVAASDARDARGIPRAPYVDAFFGLGDVYARLGEPERARQMYDDTRAGYDAVGNFHPSYTALMNLLHYVIVPYQVDDLVARQRVIEEAEWGAERVRDIRGAFPSGIEHLPLIAVEATDWDAAQRLVEWVADGPAAEEWSTSALVAVFLAQGDSETLTLLIAQTLPLGPSSAPGSVYFPSALALQRAAATLALRAGDRSVARAWLEEHDRWLAWSGSVLGRAEGALVWAEYFQHAGDIDEARRHAEQALASASAPRQPLALLAAHRFLGQLDTEERRFLDAETHLQQAFQLAEASTAPFERALALLALAELRAAQGKPTEVAALLADVRRVCEPLRAQPTLARVAATEQRLVTTPQGLPCGLSKREADVLKLLAQGLTDADIAERLFLARRTINTHLTSIYTKLGVSSRSGATRYAVEHGLI